VEQVFGVSEAVQGASTVVTVRGEVDVATAPTLRDCIDGVIDRDTGAVVVNLLEVTFIDSTGLGVLIGARRRCADEFRELHIVVGEPRILKVFEITGLTDYFPIHRTLDRALAA
jgi:anti-sigma B factor antagonist